MKPIEFVKLTGLMQFTSGRSEIVVALALIDGPILMSHPDLSRDNIRHLSGKSNGSCSHAGSTACAHDTSVAGILSANRDSVAPAICLSTKLDDSGPHSPLLSANRRSLRCGL
jgi:hypothetical protein